MYSRSTRSTTGVVTTHALLARLIALHVLAASEHQFIEKDGGVARVLPGRRTRAEPVPLAGRAEHERRLVREGAKIMCSYRLG